MRHHKENLLLIRVIAGFKLIKGLLLLAMAIGVLQLLNTNVAAQVARLLATIRVDPTNHYVHGLLTKLAHVDNEKLEGIGVGSFFYSGLFLTEGVGLFLGKRWAEYFTIIVTGSFIPLEIYELVKEPGAGKAVALAINVLVVVYLVMRQLRRRHDVARERKKRT